LDRSELTNVPIRCGEKEKKIHKVRKMNAEEENPTIDASASVSVRKGRIGYNSLYTVHLFKF